jgi:hypothetical protein
MIVDKVREESDDKSGEKYDDKSIGNIEKSRGKLDDQSGGGDLRSRVTSNDTAAWTALSGRLDATSRVTFYDTAEWTALGQMNRVGVTRYQGHTIKTKKREDGKFFWPDSVNRDGSQRYSGAKDLTESVNWGWHSPHGLYATIPVGSPLIDDESNIYLAADDAIRKFNITGELLWAYAPRGQLAAAPTLSTGCAPARLADSVMDDITSEEEELLRPDWVKGNGADLEHSLQQFFKDFKVGDLVKVKAGASYMAHGEELYSAGDQGVISSVAPDEEGKYDRAVIQWKLSGRKSAIQFDDIQKHFVRVERKSSRCTPMLIGSTTSSEGGAGVVFAIDLASGYELWVIQGEYQIAGVKGALASKDGLVMVATNRCTDRYCYRYRNQTNTLTPGNTVVRGLNVADGSQVWAYVPRAPVWNMNPVWGPTGSVFFNDQEGRLYCLELATGSEIWQAGGELGTYTEAAAVYDTGAQGNVYALGMLPYTDPGCNPYTAPGILPSCGNAPFRQGFIRAYNATSGRLKWQRVTPHPPASAAVGMLNSPRFHTRLVVTLGFNCRHNSPTMIWSVDPHSGGVRFNMDGPTLWSSLCAGDKEGGDIRRAYGGRATCSPGSWSIPIIDADGDIYTGNQVGEYQRWGSPSERNVDVQVLSSLVTGVAFQDAATALANGIMAVATCTSLIVFQSDFQDQFVNTTWTFPAHGYSP